MMIGGREGASAAVHCARLPSRPTRCQGMDKEVRLLADPGFPPPDLAGLCVIASTAAGAVGVEAAQNICTDVHGAHAN